MGYVRYVPVFAFMDLVEVKRHCHSQRTSDAITWRSPVLQQKVSTNAKLVQELEALARLSQELFSHMLAEQSTLAIVSPLPSSKLRPAVAEAFQGLNAVAPPVTWPGRRLAAMADPLPSTGQVPPCFVVQSRENPGISFTWSIPFSATSGVWVINPCGQHLFHLDLGICH